MFGSANDQASSLQCIAECADVYDVTIRELEPALTSLGIASMTLGKSR